MGNVMEEMICETIEPDTSLSHLLICKNGAISVPSMGLQKHTDSSMCEARNLTKKTRSWH